MGTLSKETRKTLFKEVVLTWFKICLEPDVKPFQDFVDRPSIMEHLFARIEKAANAKLERALALLPDAGATAIDPLVSEPETQIPETASSVEPVATLTANTAGLNPVGKQDSTKTESNRRHTRYRRYVSTENPRPTQEQVAARCGVTLASFKSYLKGRGTEKAHDVHAIEIELSSRS
jgi:hypothetical protein